MIGCNKRPPCPIALKIISALTIGTAVIAALEVISALTIDSAATAAREVFGRMAPGVRFIPAKDFPNHGS